MVSDSIPRHDPRESRSTSSRSDGDAEIEAAEGEMSTVETLIDEMIQARISHLESEIKALEEGLEEVDNFARISLNERKVQRTEANLAEFSDSLTGFAEKAFNDINELEDRLDTQALLLAAVLETLDASELDIDLEEVRKFQRANVVLRETPEERLLNAIGEEGEEGNESADAADLDRVRGVGSAYAERLHGAGIETVSDLAGADADDLGERIDISPSRVADWIDHANELTA
jgi:predicted flap endonuclease-1-like 5' DNA nuclease